MKSSDYINDAFLLPEKLASTYATNAPYPHIVMDGFIKEGLLRAVADEFPDLSRIGTKIEYDNPNEIKLASDGFADISPTALKLITFLNSDIFLQYLNALTGINEPLISDAYLSGGGYHEIKHGGRLEVHADFNKHPRLNLDRRLNLLLYLNKGWKAEWGGSLQLYDKDDLNNPVVSVTPEFNRCVIFSTTSFTYHGHPETINCPLDRSRKSIALYYFSTGRPTSEVSDSHSTLFASEQGDSPPPLHPARDDSLPLLTRYAWKLRWRIASRLGAPTKRKIRKALGVVGIRV